MTGKKLSLANPAAGRAGDRYETTPSTTGRYWRPQVGHYHSRRKELAKEIRDRKYKGLCKAVSCPCLFQKRGDYPTLEPYE
jgi:hypothetical protein